MRSLLALLCSLCIASVAFASEKPLVVHEWGTFTSLQDESGRAIGGININDEPLPRFVHRFGPGVVSDDNGGKGLTLSHPDVTLRLETPVIYFYPGDKPLTSLDVSATFNGGLLTEFYPNAAISIDDQPKSQPPDRITDKTRGGLTWQHVTFPSDVVMPTTTSHVWNAPRKVKSAPVSANEEAEQYIFYRGVGHFNAPVQVVRRQDILELRDTADFARQEMWLTEFRGDGACAFRAITADARTTSASFADGDFASQNLDALKKSMRTALIKAGLFEDEADAMLETWKLSYFRSGGQRLFFIVPRQWTDSVLPLKISQPCDLTRVMMGRIELVTPPQREAITKLSDPKLKSDPATQRKLLDSLGRFATPLIQDAARMRNAAASAR